MEERLLRLTSAGVLEWYKVDSVETARGALQMHGLDVSTDFTRGDTILITTVDRIYVFTFQNTNEALMWLKTLRWYSVQEKSPWSVGVGNTRN